MGGARGAGRPRGVRGTRRGDLERGPMRQISLQDRAYMSRIEEESHSNYVRTPGTPGTPSTPGTRGATYIFALKAIPS